MDKPEWEHRIDQDMALVPTMTLPETLRFLDGYSQRVFGEQILRGELHVRQIQTYADKALERAWERAR